MPGISRRELLSSGVALSASSLLAALGLGVAPPRLIADSGRQSAEALPRWLRASNCCSISAGSSRLATAAIRRAIWDSATARATSPRPAI